MHAHTLRYTRACMHTFVQLCAKVSLFMPMPNISVHVRTLCNDEDNVRARLWWVIRVITVIVHMHAGVRVNQVLTQLHLHLPWASLGEGCSPLKRKSGLLKYSAGAALPSLSISAAASPSSPSSLAQSLPALEVSAEEYPNTSRSEIICRSLYQSLGSCITSTAATSSPSSTTHPPAPPPSAWACAGGVLCACAWSMRSWLLQWGVHWGSWAAISLGVTIFLKPYLHGCDACT